jgi:hypothetical protein
MGQGLFLRSTADNASLIWNAEARVHVQRPIFKKDSEETQESDLQYLMIEAKNTLGYEDVAFVSFGDNGTTGFENGLDISKLFGGAEAPQLYMMNDDHQQSANYLASLKEDETRIVPLYFRTSQEGEQLFTASFNKLGDTEVYLEDLKTGTMHNWVENPAYTFTHTNGYTDKRFNVHFKYAPTSINDPFAASDKLVNIYAWDKAVYIENKDNSNNSEVTISIFDMYGRQLYMSTSQLDNNMRVPVNVSNNYLVVRVMKDNNVYTEKVFIR